MFALPRRPLPGDRWGTGSGSPRTPCAWPPRCARRSARAGSRTRSTSTTARRSSTPGCCAPAPSSGIRLVHSTPGRPQGRGKIERFFRTVREQFLVEITGDPGRATRPAPGRRPGRAEPAVHRLGRDRLPPPRPLRDRAAAAGALARRRPVPAARPRPRWRGVPLGSTPHRHQDRAGVAARQHLPGRPAAGRAPGRAGLRPVRPDHVEVRLPRRPGRHRDPAPDRPPLPPQGPTRDPTRRRPPPTGIDYARLIDAAHHAQLGRAGQLRRPRRQHARPAATSCPASSTCSPTTRRHRPTPRLTAR